MRAHQSAHSALSGSSWADTPSYRNVLYPRGALQLLETMAIALDRRLVRLCRHLSKNINCEAERWRVISWRFSSGKTANSRVFCRQCTQMTQTLNPPCAHAHRVTRWDDSCKSKGTRWNDTCKSKTRPSEPRLTLKCQVFLHQRLKSRALPELVVSFEGSARANFNFRGLCPS